ncbi:hypothetical protein F4779DRAFT_614599 [Xylariaceae sp. FL0662B]|nr:hypothetical protein F4779DRAFT_614599 [Xylariaceae sp. FL0662B]
MESEAKKLALFEEAMQKVYGPYNADVTAPDSAWTPPSSPGAGGHRGRYLWTDAFGVINFITLSREKRSQGPAYLARARTLAETVHAVLGSTRDGTARLPGATADAPLNGGLRIGKAESAGPDGDGQYHHYLTLWMFALNRLALATGEARWNDLAIQLAKAVHPHFMTRRPGSGPGRETMVWKISTDMRRVLVPSKGHLDDVDGFVVFRLLQETRRRHFHDDAPAVSLDDEIDDYRRIMAQDPNRSLSGDPLDLGMSMWVAHLDRVAAWSRALAADGLRVARERFLPASRAPLTARTRYARLAFREFGACMGIKCYFGDRDGDEAFRPLLEGAEAVLNVWEEKLDEGGDEDLRPINLVMYAAALIPGAFRDGYLGFKSNP